MIVVERLASVYQEVFLRSKSQRSVFENARVILGYAARIDRYSVDVVIVGFTKPRDAERRVKAAAECQDDGHGGKYAEEKEAPFVGARKQRIGLAEVAAVGSRHFDGPYNMSAPSRALPMSDAAIEQDIRVRTAGVAVWKMKGRTGELTSDLVAIEDPLEIRLVTTGPEGIVERRLAVTMRTPGNDVELALGFLSAEGIIRTFNDVERVRHSATTANVLTVTLRAAPIVDTTRLLRYSFTSSSCGVCGKTSLEALDLMRPVELNKREGYLDPEVIGRLPGALRDAQPVFERTGGLHAAGLANEECVILDTREDVGRHNAVDKLVGSLMMRDGLPCSQGILVVSGRASFELVQKALVAGFPVMAAVGAPSSLAVELARSSGMTLCGFVRGRRFNVYTHPGRLRGTPKNSKGDGHETQNIGQFAASSADAI